MSVQFKNGDTVRQVIAPIEGQVMRFAFDPQTGEIAYLVGWTDAEGNAHERSFAEDEIEAAPEATTPKVVAQ
jgi:hypothetical protein